MFYRQELIAQFNLYLYLNELLTSMYASVVVFGKDQFSLVTRIYMKVVKALSKGGCLWLTMMHSLRAYR